MPRRRVPGTFRVMLAAGVLVSVLVLGLALIFAPPIDEIKADALKTLGGAIMAVAGGIMWSNGQQPRYDDRDDVPERSEPDIHPH
jgi:hypothetical protein